MWPIHLGVLPLAFAIVESTRIFFTMMVGVLIIGWGYGVVALPVARLMAVYSHNTAKGFR